MNSIIVIVTLDLEKNALKLNSKMSDYRLFFWLNIVASFVLSESGCVMELNWLATFCENCFDFSSKKWGFVFLFGLNGKV